MHRLIATGLTLAVLATPAPARAAEPERLGMTPVVLSDPWLAASLSGGSPLGMFVLTPITGGASLALMPAGTGIGHAYAGDPGRGFLVGLGGYTVAGLGFWAGATLRGWQLDRDREGRRRGAAASNGPLIPPSAFSGIGIAIREGVAEGVAKGVADAASVVLFGAIGALATTAAYSGWAAWDAYRTAERRNAEAAAAAQ